METTTDEIRPQAKELNWQSKIYVHFCRSEGDADKIVAERKLRQSRTGGRQDRIFAVDLDETVRNDRVQLGNRVWAIAFTTPEAGNDNNFRHETYWFFNERDEEGGYIPLDMVVKLNWNDAAQVRKILETTSPEHGEPDDPQWW